MMADELKQAVDKKSIQSKSKDKTGHVEKLQDQATDNGSDKSQKREKRRKRLNGHVHKISAQNDVQDVERRKTKKESIDSKEDFFTCESSMQPDEDEQPTEESQKANGQEAMSLGADPSVGQAEKKKKKKKRKYEEVDNDDTQGQNKYESKKDRKEKKQRKHDGLSSTSSSLLSTPAESSTPSNDTSHPTYTSSAISIMSPSFAVEAEAFLRKHSIKIDTPKGVPRVAPVIKFSQLNVPAEIQSAFVGFKEPTPIQACTWPPALEGRDVVGIAETGSGKTLAFGIPAICHLLKSHTKHVQSTVSVLVVAPTRELALQTHDTLTSLGAPFGIASVAVFGGVAREPQVKMLKNASKGRDGMTTKIIVGTPGRLLDLMQEGACDLSGVDYLVLDEADRMLDKGFENDIRNIISSTRPSEHRQTMMFSATWPESVRRLASTFQRNPVRVTVGSDDLTANSRVEQSVDVFDDSRSKDQRLLNLLKSLSHKKKTTSGDESRVLVFALYKKEASRVEQMLRRQGYSVGALHGDMLQNARLEALENFKNGTTGLMVATDVAARGLDIPNVGAVVNYTFPLTIEDYIHRIGRTGRGGKSGKSITFFTGEAHERALAGELARVLREGGFDYEALKKFPMTIKKKEHGAYGAFYRDDIPIPKGPTKIVF